MTWILIRGGGDLGTGVAHRLYSAGFKVVIVEVPQPLVVRRAVAFAEAVYTGSITVEGVTARRVAGEVEAGPGVVREGVPVMVDAEAQVFNLLRPPVVVDARMLKANIDTRRNDAPLVIGLGPGFVAGQNCQAVVETRRGHNLGRVYWAGGAEADTGRPEDILGVAAQRVLRADRAGRFVGCKHIGDPVTVGAVMAEIDGLPLRAQCAGVVRGLLHDGLQVTAGMKVGDIDPRGVREFCFSISDKARAVGGGVLEAVCRWQRQMTN